MKVIQQLLIAWMFVTFLMLQGFGQDILKPLPPPPTPPPKKKITQQPVTDENSSKPELRLDLENLPPPPPPPNIAPPHAPPDIKPTPDSVSDGNSSKPKNRARTISTPKGRIIPPPRPIPPQIMWFEFTYNSPEEKAFWDKLPDWQVRELRFPKKVNVLGQSIDYNSTKGYTGLVKNQSSYYAFFGKSDRIREGHIVGNPTYERIIYQFVDGFLLRKASWNRQGQKEWERNYKEGKLEGLLTEWYESGQKKRQTNYKDSNKNGIETGWHENGQKMYERNFKDGKLEGLWTEWYDFGQKDKEKNYKDGKLMSAEVWKPDGEKCSISDVKAGNGMMVIYAYDGTEWSRTSYKDGERIKKNNPRQAQTR